MFAIISVILALLSLGGTILFMNENFFASANNQYEIAETEQRLLETAARIEANWRYYYSGGTAYLLQPAPTTGSAPYIYSQVPSWINSIARSASGVPFLYCPYASYGAISGTSSGTSQMPDGGATVVTTILNNSTTNNQNYLTNTSQTVPSGLPADTRAVLIAAAPGRKYPPLCSDVVLGRNNYPTVPGGLVVPIRDDDYSMRMQSPHAPGVPTLFVGTAASGDGSGRGPSDLIAIDDAFTLINVLKPSAAKLVLGSATFSPTVSIPTDTPIFFSGNGTANTTLNFTNISNWVIGEKSEYNLTALTVSNLSNLEIRGELHGSNIMGLSNVHINGGRLLWDNQNNSLTAGLTIDGDGAFISPSQFVNMTTTANGGVNINVGSFLHTYTGYNGPVINGASGTTPVYIGAGGRWASSSVNAYVTINASSGTLNGGMIVFPGGILRQDVPVINNAANYGILLEGQMISERNATTVGFTGTAPVDGIIFANGGSFEGFVGAIGSASNYPKYAISDQGGSFFQPSYFTIYANSTAGGACWRARSGTSLFSYSANANNTSFIAGSGTTAITYPNFLTSRMTSFAGINNSKCNLY